MGDILSLSLPAGFDAPAAARLALDDIEGLEYEERERLRLLVSELVTNAVRHAGLTRGDEIAFELEVDDERVFGTVRDPGPGFEAPELDGASSRNDHWGLWLVNEIADRWGIARESGATVWFEMARAG